MNDVIITVGNWGYRDMIMSWWLNIYENAREILDKVVVVVWEEELKSYLNKHLPKMNVKLVDYHKGKQYKDSITFKNAGWDIVTRFKLLAIWDFISKNVNVTYLDPDVVLFKNILLEFNKDKANGKVLIQEGKPFCSGVLYVPISEASKVAFDPKTWGKWSSDDEKYLIHHFKKPRSKSEKDWSGQIKVLPLRKYPNGLLEEKLWFKEVSEIKDILNKNSSVLLHFNYISGYVNKVFHIKRLGYWKKPLRIVKVPSVYQSILGDVCMEKNKSKYPPHQKGYQIETFFHNYLESKIKQGILCCDYDYLPIYWTALAVGGDSTLKNKARDWIKNYMNSNPNTKCFTVVQHCKSIEGTLGIVLPKNWIIFSTSNPNYAKDLVGATEKKVFMCDHSKGLPLGKMKLLNNPQPLIGIGRVQTKSSITKGSRQKKVYQSTRTQFDVSNHKTIPLLCSPHLSKPILGDGQRGLLASFVGNLNIHKIRKDMEKIFFRKEGILVRDGKYLNGNDVKEFENLMKISTFALCPRGFGNTSFRLIEAMEYGCIPVYISDHHSLPFKEFIDWNGCCIVCDDGQIGTLYKRMKDIVANPSKLREMQKNVYDVYNRYFTYERCSECITECIKECIE